MISVRIEKITSLQPVLLTIGLFFSPLPTCLASLKEKNVGDIVFCVCVPRRYSSNANNGTWDRYYCGQEKIDILLDTQFDAS